MDADPPIILWPHGQTARLLAGRLMADAAHGAAGSRDIQLFDPQGDFKGPLKQQVAAAAHRQGYLAAGVEVRLLAGAWELSAPIGTLLREISDILAAAIPGNQSLTLSLLIPPAVACRKDVETSRQTLQDLAESMTGIRFLGSVLLFPVLPDLYRTPNGPADSLLDLVDFLRRSILDPETIATVHRFGTPLIRNGCLADGEHAGFTSLTARRARYEPGELLRYLYARFQFELFTLGLYARDNPPKGQREDIEELVERLTDRIRRTLSERYLALGPWSSLPNLGPWDDPRGKLQGREVCDQRLSQTKQTITQTNDLEERRLHASLADLFGGIEQDMRGELEGLLDLSPSYLSAARCFLDALTGLPAPGVGDREPRGLVRLERELRQQPLQQQAAAFFSHWFGTTVAHYGSVPPREGSATMEQLEPLAELLALPAKQQGPGDGAPARFLVGAWQRIGLALTPPLVTPNDAHRMWDEIAGLFLAELAAVCQLLGNLDEDRQALEEERRALRRAHPWYKPWRLLDYGKVKRELRERGEATDRRQGDALAGIAFTGELLQSLAGEFLWPHYARVLLVDGVHQALDRVRSTFHGFVHSLETPWRQEWGEAQQIRITDRWSDCTVNTRVRGDALYARILPRPVWSRLVAEALTYVPGLADRGGEDPPAYATYSTLCEHYNTEAQHLLERVADLAQYLFRAAMPLQILDIVELPDQSAGRTFLQQVQAVMDSQPEFASAKIPHLVQQGLFQRQRLIRCTPAIGHRLRSDYGYLFGSSDTFQEIEDPNLLDVTTFTFGFPPSLLHFVSMPAPTVTDESDLIETEDATIPTTVAASSDEPAALKNEGAIVISTVRKGNSHTLTATLEGANGIEIAQMLMVDTGATSVVLPASLIRRLGLSREDLTLVEAQTANGVVDNLAGILPAVWLNDRRIPDVAVAFGEDERLGGEGLLGMSVLSRFRLTIDDDRNQIILEPQ